MASPFRPAYHWGPVHSDQFHAFFPDPTLTRAYSQSIFRSFSDLLFAAHATLTLVIHLRFRSLFLYTSNRPANPPNLIPLFHPLFWIRHTTTR